MDMSVKIAGVEWKNPVTVASGTFGSGEEFSEFVDLNRLGAVTTKGVANVPWPGNPTPRVAEVYGGMMNAIGLQNPGIDLFCKRDIPYLKKFDTKIIVNVCGHAPEEYLEVVERLADEPIDMMEINISCPNVNAGFLAFGQDAKHVEELTLEIANTRSVTPQVKEEVINEFYEVCLAQQYIAEGGINYAKELLEKALGSDKAMDVIGKLTASLQVKPFEFVRKTDASQLINFIQDEHPQTIALILSYLSPSQAALIISALPPDSQAEVARRIAVMDRTSPDVIKEVEKVLESKLASLVNQDYTIIGGVDAVVDILNTVDRGTEKHIMETLEIEEPELADEIRKKMFVFEDILLLDDKAIQRVLRDVDNNDLAVALKGANEQVQNAIFNNLSKRLVVMIKEDMEFMGPVRMKDVEEAQQKIVNIIRKLEDSGEIIISRGGGDEIVV